MFEINRGNDAITGRLVLMRHGQTAWSESGQYTGRTNIPLTDVGEQQARDAGVRIRELFPQGFDSDCVFASPLRRAQQTACLAGFDPKPLDALMEWDYGRAEGRTRATVRQMHGGEWDVWRDGPQSLDQSMEGDWTETLPNGERVPVHNGPGESVEDVYERVQIAIDTALPKLTEGRNVLFVAHAHVLRILTMRWLGLEPHLGRLLRFDTAHYSVLTVYKGDRVIERWNC